jgi:hypothetical protein
MYKTFGQSFELHSLFHVPSINSYFALSYFPVFSISFFSQRFIVLQHSCFSAMAAIRIEVAFVCLGVSLDLCQIILFSIRCSFLFLVAFFSYWLISLLLAVFYFPSRFSTSPWHGSILQIFISRFFFRQQFLL